MATISVTELKARLSEQLRRVKRGESLVVTERGRAVARLVPASATQGVDEVELARLEAAGILRRGSGELPDHILRGAVPLDPEAAVRRALREEREAGW